MCVASFAHQDDPDLSTPESTVRAFTARIADGKLNAAAKCVVGAEPGKILEKMEQDQRRLKAETLAISVDSVIADVSGPHASTRVKATMDMSHIKKDLSQSKIRPPQSLADRIPPTVAFEETIQLEREGVRWKIVPPTMDEIKRFYVAVRTKNQTSLGNIALSSGVVRYPEVFEKAREEARRVTCGTNLKRIMVAVLMYTQDHNDRTNFKAATFKQALTKYLDKPAVFRCPSDAREVDSYTFNPALQGASLIDLNEPYRTVAVYEGSNGVISFRHNGRANIGFADGHVRVVTPADTKLLLWKP